MDLYFWILNAIAIIATAAFGAILLSYITLNNTSKKNKEKAELLEKENIALKVSLEHSQNTLDELKASHAKELQKQGEFYKNEFESLNAKLNENFKDTLKSAKNELLNLNSEKISASSNELVKSVLENQIKPLKDEIAKYANENLKLTTTFSTNFENLKAMSLELGKQADGLANALRGNKKMTGNWGETQLDLVLENSGLILGQNYEKQVYFTDENGIKRFLDAVVDFGDGKKAIIDSKCSLVHYLDFVNASDEETSKTAKKELAKDLKAHIDGLSDKEYQKFTNSYEYIFMFVPNENMLYTALEADNGLYQYAYEKGIFLTTPLTLLMAMRTIYLCWQNLKVDANSRKIFEKAGDLYDKISAFSLDYDTLGRNIETLLSNYNKAKNKLSDGKGNILKRTQDLKLLGAKVTKEINKEYNDDEYDNADDFDILKRDEKGEILLPKKVENSKTEFSKNLENLENSSTLENSKNLNSENSHFRLEFSDFLLTENSQKFTQENTNENA